MNSRKNAVIVWLSIAASLLIFNGCDGAKQGSLEEPYLTSKVGKGVLWTRPGLKPNKTVRVFSLEKLDTDSTHGIQSPLLRGIVSSMDGLFVYVVGKGKHQLKAYDVGLNEWIDPLDWARVPRAMDRNRTKDIRGFAVGAFVESNEGLLFTVTNNQGLVVIKGRGGQESSMLYVQDDAQGFPKGKFVPHQVVNQDDKKFLYLLPTTNALQAFFRPYVTPTQEDSAPWQQRAMNKKVLARAQDQRRNFFIAHPDGIVRFSEGSLGKKDAEPDEGKPVIGFSELRLSKGVDNNGINTMALVDEKYLLIGLESTKKNNGGLVYTDITKAPLVWKKFGDGMGLSVDHIATERVRNPEKTVISAIATTNRGYLIFSKGEVVELVKNRGYLIDAQMIDTLRAEVENYDTAADGFSGARIKTPNMGGYQSPAQDIKGRWYLPINGKRNTENGVFRLEIQTQQVEVPVLMVPAPHEPP